MTRTIPLTLLTDSPLPESFPRPSHATIVRLPQTGLRWHVAVAKLVRAQDAATVYVSPTSYIVPALVGRQASTVIVVHDLIAFRQEPHERKATLIERLTLRRAAMTARHVLTTSNATRDDLLSRYPGLPKIRVTTVHAGVVQEGVVQNTDAASAILCLGTLCPRKNQLRLIEAYAQLPEELKARHPLLLGGGRGWRDAAIVQKASTTPGVRFLGYVTDDALESLYADTAIIACPSLYEGFGLPVLTGFARGIPVLTSDRGSLREVAGDAALIVDPESVASIADGLKRLLTEPQLRASCRQRGLEQAKAFTWKKTVDAFLDALA